MENSIGIEAARARLGDLADEVRDTGQVTHLTRYGKTVAILGPAEAVKPRAAIPVTLNFPHEDWQVEMHAVPRIGDTVEWDTANLGSGQWKVTEVIWTPETTGPGDVGLTLDPANEHTRQLMEKQNAVRLAHARKANTQYRELTKAVEAERGTWDMERTVETLAAAGHEVSAKRARELLRRAADTGLLVKADPDRAVYNTAEQ